MSIKRNKLLVILGPTATGKTDLALLLAKKLIGELLACDSRQVYIGLDIGTGKLPSEKLGVRKKHNFWEIDGEKVWMYDMVDPKLQYTVADYVKDASKVIDRMVKSDKLPIIVGGTGLYLKALLEGLSNLSIPVSGKLRSELSKLSLKDLQQRLQKLSNERWESLNESDKKNPRRLPRSIELLSMYPYKLHNNIVPLNKKFDILKIGLIAPINVLREKISKRQNFWLSLGLINEVKRLLQGGLSLKRLREIGLEYSLIADYLERKIDKETLVNKLRIKTGQYAKRQITWFKKERNVLWFDITDANYTFEVERKVAFWYHQANESKN